MDIKIKILANIQALEEAEFSLVDTLYNKIKYESAYQSLVLEPKELIRYIHSFSPNKEKVNSADGNWVNATDGISVLSQLVYNSNIIIDLKPNIKSNEDFIRQYGFSVMQLLTLARRGKVTFNLIGYESNKGKEFSEYLKFEGTDHEKRAYCDLFLIENGMRINSIRRKLFFRVGLENVNENYDNYVEEGRAIFSRIHGLPSGQLDKIKENAVFRSDSINGLVESLSQQYGYNKVMSILGLVPEESKKLNELISNSIVADDGLVKYSEMVRGLKVLTASPLLASMGGIYSLSYSSVAAIRKFQASMGRLFIEKYDIFDIVKSDLERHELKESIKKVILNSILKRKELINKSIKDMPDYIRQDHFEGYLSFIDEMEKEKRTLCKHMENLSKNPYLTEKRFEELERYMLTQKNIFNNYDKFYKTIHSTVGNSIQFSAGALIGYFTSHNILISLGSGTVGAVVSNSILPESVVDKIMRNLYSNKHQLLLDVAGIKSLI